MSITPLINHYYCMKVYKNMVKKNMTMCIDENGILWHINDLRDILETKKVANG